MSDEGCSGRFAEIIAREVSPLDHHEHPGLERLFDLSSHDVSSETRAELVGHLATCEACRGRWKKLQAHLHDEATVLGSRARIPSLAQYIGERSARRRSVPTWTRRLFESKPYMVLAASAATLVLTLGVSIPLLRGGGSAAIA
jgi:predicted anti-sigma-YlaC factor YlaD